MQKKWMNECLTTLQAQSLKSHIIPMGQDIEENITGMTHLCHREREREKCFI